MIHRWNCEPRLLADELADNCIRWLSWIPGVRREQRLRDALSERVQDELLERGSRLAELPRRTVVQALWEEHQSGKRSHHWTIYSMLSREWW